MVNIRFLMLWAQAWQTYVKCYRPKHRKHPRLDAVVWYSRFTTFAEKTSCLHFNETNVFRVCCAPVNTRQGIHRLPQLVRSDDLKSSEGDVYVCFNRPRNRIKMLSIGTP